MVLFFKKINIVFILTFLFAFFSISLSQFGGNLKFTYPYLENTFSFFALPKFAFYFTLTRIWEILVGCLLALFLFKNKKKFNNKNFVLLGYLLIFLSIFFFDRNTLHPSVITLIPITGTLLVLAYSSTNFNENGVFVVFNNYILLKIGLISYSLYLWHQPIYQFFNQIYFIDTNNVAKLLIIILLIILSFFSFKFIEQPFRDKKRLIKKIFLYFIFYPLY